MGSLRRKWRGNIPRAWSTDAITCDSELVSEESKKRAKKLYEVEYDKRNWSWLLNSNKPDVPLAIPRDEPSTRDATGRLSMPLGEPCEDEAPLEEKEDQAQAAVSLKKKVRVKKSTVRASLS